MSGIESVIIMTAAPIAIRAAYDGIKFAKNRIDQHRERIENQYPEEHSDEDERLSIRVRKSLSHLNPLRRMSETRKPTPKKVAFVEKVVDEIPAAIEAIEVALPIVEQVIPIVQVVLPILIRRFRKR